MFDSVALFAVEGTDRACHAFLEGLILAEAEGEAIVVVESDRIVVLGLVWIIVVICVLSDKNTKTSASSCIPCALFLHI